MNNIIYISSLIKQFQKSFFGLSRADILLFLFSAALYLSSIWHIGFYSDDFNALFNFYFAKSEFYGSIISDRPIGGIVYCLIATISQMEIVPLHIFSKGMYIISILALSRFMFALNTKLYGSPDRSRTASLLATLLYIANPWTLVVPLTATFFCFSMAIACLSVALTVITEPTKYSKPHLLAFSLYLIACLTYQAFWLSFIPLTLIIVINAILNRQYAVEWYLRKKIIIYLCFAQLLCFITTIVGLVIHHMRYFKGPIALVGTQGKQIRLDLLERLINKTIQLPNILAEPFTNYLTPSLLNFVGFRPGTVLISLIVITFVFILLLGNERHRFLMLLPYLLSTLSGIIISISVFMLANYDISVNGYFSRTAVMIPFWLSVAASLLTCAALAQRSAIVSILTYLLIFVSLIFETIQNVHEVESWNKANASVEKLLNTVPIEKLTQLPKDGVLLVQFPKNFDALDTLGSAWSLSGSILTRHQILAEHFGVRWFALPARFDEWLTFKSGQQIKQKWCHTPKSQLNFETEVAEVAIWDVGSNDVTLQRESIASWGCTK